MARKVMLRMTKGPIEGRTWAFTEHDTFIFGRAPDCHARLDDSDTTASRHHFLLEVNPPEARIRDLGSRNGTRINGEKSGGRARHETAEEGRARRFPEVDLADGDVIEVGDSALAVSIEGRAAAAPALDADPLAVLLAALDEAPPPAVVAGDEAPAVAGYRIGRRLGSGSMGAVHAATRLSDGAEVAIKVLLARVAVDAEARAAFLREVEALDHLRHPHIVAVLDRGGAGSAFYFVMERCDGGSLDDVLALHDGKLALDRALPIALQALDGLAHAHREGLVHRDVKPANVLFTGDGTAKLSDFGLAKRFQQAGLSGMTVTGSFAGTMEYMPREQLTNFKRVTPASDVWSMGATLYRAITGTTPLDFAPDKDPMAVLLLGNVVPLNKRAPTLPAALGAVLDKALARDPKDRFADAGEMRQALTRVR